MRKLLYIDSSYSLSQLRDRALDRVLHVRFLDGYFDKVWSAHPVDTHPSLTKDVAAIGSPLFTSIANNHIFVRGRYGRFRVLRRLAPLNALFALLSFIRRLIRLARTEGIKTIRAGDPLLCGLIGVITAKATGAHLVVRINGDHDMIRANTGRPIMPSLFRLSVIENWVERAVLKRADWIIAPSANYGEFAVRKGANPKCVTVVRYGNLIDGRHITPPKLREPVGDPSFLARLKERHWMVHIGRLHEIKHAEDCYEVLKLMAEKDALGEPNKKFNVGLLMIGDGPLREKLTQRAEADGLNDHLFLTGNLDQPTLARALPYCKIVLSPLTGRSLAEAAYAALPIVAYDLDWQGELVKSNLTGFLVPARDVYAMAEAASKLFADPVLAGKMGKAARTQAQDLLSPDEQTRREIELYQRLDSTCSNDNEVNADT